MIYFITSSIPDQQHPSRGIFSLKLASCLSKYEKLKLFYPAHRGNINYAFSCLSQVNHKKFSISKLFSFPGLSHINSILWTLQLIFSIIRLPQNTRICVFAYFFSPGSIIFPFLKKFFGNIFTVVHHSESKSIQSIASASKIKFNFIIKNTNLILFNNPGSENHLSELIHDLRITNHPQLKFVPSGYDAEEANRILSINKNYARLPPSPPGRLKIACIGTVSHRKGQQLIIDSLASLDLKMKHQSKLHYSSVSLSLVGPLVDNVNFPPLINCQFKMLGALSHEQCLHEIINSDLICQPSLSEGMSNVVVEAIALGKPIIMSDIPSNRYLALSNHKALLSFPASIEQLTKLLASVIMGESCLSDFIIDPKNILTLDERARIVHEAFYQ